MIDVGLHRPYPWFFPRARLTIVHTRCDRDGLTAILPPGFALRGDGRVSVWTLECDDIAGVGAYRELMISIPAVHAGRDVVSMPLVYVDNDAAMASGREVIGLAKRIAAFDSQRVNDQRVVRVARSGVEFLTMGMTLDRPGTDDDVRRVTAGLSRPSFNPLGDTVVESRMTAEVDRVVHGRGFVDARPSASDPLYLLAPVATGAVFVECSLTLHPPTTHPAAGEG